MNTSVKAPDDFMVDANHAGTSSNIRWLCCGILRKEIEQLLQQGRISGKVHCLNSMLHMYPDRLQKTLEGIMTSSNDSADVNGSGCKTKLDVINILVYGDCCPRMVDITEKFDLIRVDAVNCAQILLGKKHYRELMRRESFIFLPEWAERWEEIFRVELGFTTCEQARIIMKDSRSELVYIDDGICDVPLEKLKECSEYTELPLRIEKVDLQNLALLLENTAEMAVRDFESRHL